MPDDFRYIIDAATGQGGDSQLHRIMEKISGNNQHNKELVSHLVKLMATKVREKNVQKSVQEDNPLIVVEER